jgi:TetR/AcrR family transcriptional regulator, transcriptional repressor for nem operon
MRYPDGHKESVGARIVEAASRALRQDGVDAVSIPKLMKLAGLTHGGFYVHFRDRDDLIAKAVAHAASDSLLTGDKPPADTFDAYLSKKHVLHPEYGCVVAALGAEGARQKGPLRRVFAEIARGFLRHVEHKLHPKAAQDALSDEALATASRIVGAIVLARLVHDDALSERILAAAKRSQRT